MKTLTFITILAKIAYKTFILQLLTLILVHVTENNITQTTLMFILFCFISTLTELKTIAELDGK